MNTKEYFKSLFLIWVALIIGQVMFGAVVFYLHKTGAYTGDESLNQTFLMIVPAFVVAGIAGSILFLKMKLKQLKQLDNFESKLEQYRAATIISYALLEGPSLLGIVAFLISGNIVFFALSIMIILMFLISKPSKYKLSLDLELSEEEKKLFEVDE